MLQQLQSLTQSKRYLAGLILPLLFPVLIFQAASAAVPREETLRISKFLKPIPNAEWSSITSVNTVESYEIVSGDTLYDISKRLFGNGLYWPKVWSINNGRITNPHWIKPGNTVVFLSGSGTSLPQIGINKVPGMSDLPSEQKRVAEPKRSNEWENLPKQKWELLSVKLPADIDPLGFDKSNKINFKHTEGFELEAIVSSDEIDPLGELAYSRSDASILSLGDTVFIDPEQNLEVGELYTVTQSPYVLQAQESDRAGYSYLNLGTVKIIGLRDNLYVGSIISAKHPIARGAFLIPLIDRVGVLDPIAGPSPIEGRLLFDRNLSTEDTAQHKQVAIDLGTDDGVEVGMIFRAYQHDDPGTDQEISSADFIIDADIIVTQTSEFYSSGLVINSKRTIKELNTVVLLTDVSSFKKVRRRRVRTVEEDKVDDILDELDELDQLDSGDELSDAEKRELRQMENWKENPESNTKPEDNEEGEGEWDDKDGEDGFDNEEELTDEELDQDLEGDGDAENLDDQNLGDEEIAEETEEVDFDDSADEVPDEASEEAEDSSDDEEDWEDDEDAEAEGSGDDGDTDDAAEEDDNEEDW